jgi:hypothetical protein
MKKFTRMLGTLGIVFAMALGVGVCSSDALAIDRIVLKDGSVIEGTIVREAQGAVWIKTTIGGVPAERMYLPSEFTSIERNAATAPAEATRPATGGDVPVVPAVPAVTTPAAPRSGVPRGVVITLGDRDNGDMVGVYMVANILERAIPVIEQEIGTDGTGVVVLRFMSGGGYGAEVQKISDVIHNEYKKRWRTVGWIDSAISAAAMSAHCLEEIYFTTRGNYGACTGFYGSLDKPVEGFELEKSLHQMEKISARGGYDYRIMRSMQIMDPLSATIDANGEVHYFADTVSGDIIVNRNTEILTFNAVSAAKVKFSRGTADTLDELSKAMGFQEIQWVGKTVKGSLWPISRAEQMQMDFRKKVKTDEDNLNRYYANYAIHVQLAAGAPREERPPLVNRARQGLEQIKSMVRNNPAFARNIWGGREEYKEWLEEQEKLLRDLMR